MFWVFDYLVAVKGFSFTMVEPTRAGTFLMRRDRIDLRRLCVQLPDPLRP